MNAWFRGSLHLCELHRVINDKFPLHFADEDHDAMQTYCLSYSNAKYIVHIGGCESSPAAASFVLQLATPGGAASDNRRVKRDRGRGRKRQKGQPCLSRRLMHFCSSKSITLAKRQITSLFSYNWHTLYTLEYLYTSLYPVHSSFCEEIWVNTLYLSSKATSHSVLCHSNTSSRVSGSQYILNTYVHPVF